MVSKADQLLELYGASQLDESFGVSVKLRRSAQETAAFVATWEDHVYEFVDGEGFLTRIHARSFVFAKASPVLNGVAVIPRAGDELVIVDELTSHRIADMGKMPAVASLPGEYRWRVHTKQV